LIPRKERPHPGAQLRITDADGLRVTGFLTNTGRSGSARQLADLELRHRRHTRVEDRIRAAKDLGMRNLPFHNMSQNRIWRAITALAGELRLDRAARATRHRRALRAETAPATHPRHRRATRRSGRRHILKIDRAGPGPT
jgi:hypothetical protein